MTEPSPAFQEAMNILAQDPLPADAEARLEELEKQIRPEEVEAFGDLWEAFIVAQNVLKEG